MRTILVLTATCLFTLNTFSQDNDSTAIGKDESKQSIDTANQKVLGDTPEVKKAGDTTRIRLGKKGITIVEKNGKSSVTIDNIEGIGKDDEEANKNDKYDYDNLGDYFEDK